MIRGMVSSGLGMISQQDALDTTADNLANVNTNGFKRRTVDFQDLMYNGGDNLQVGSGVKTAAISTRDFAQGPPELTDNQLDLFIDGQGFFRVLLPDGSIGYTRDGAFTPDANGQVVNSDGLVLQPPITIPEDTLSLSVGTDGVVTAITAANPTIPVVLGNLTLSRFINPAGLRSLGGNLYQETPNSGAAITDTPGENAVGTIQQGMLERSNVDLALEFTNLIVSQRSFQVNARAFRVSDELWQTSNNLISQFG